MRAQEGPGALAWESEAHVRQSGNPHELCPGASNENGTKESERPERDRVEPGWAELATREDAIDEPSLAVPCPLHPLIMSSALAAATLRRFSITHPGGNRSKCRNATLDFLLLSDDRACSPFSAQCRGLLACRVLQCACA